MEYSFDYVCYYIKDHLRCNGYNPDELFHIDFFDESIVEVRTLAESGFDLNDDGTVYRDSDGRPVNTTPCEYHHLAEDITMLASPQRGIYRAIGTALPFLIHLNHLYNYGHRITQERIFGNDRGK